MQGRPLCLDIESGLGLYLSTLFESTARGDSGMYTGKRTSVHKTHFVMITFIRTRLYESVTTAKKWECQIAIKTSLEYSCPFVPFDSLHYAAQIGLLTMDGTYARAVTVLDFIYRNSFQTAVTITHSWITENNEAMISISTKTIGIQTLH